MHTYNLFQIENKTIDDIINIRHLTLITIENHLAKCVQDGLPLNMDKLGHSEKYHEMIIKIINSPPINNDISKLRPIKNKCPSEVTYSMIKCSIALIQNGRNY